MNALMSRVYDTGLQAVTTPRKPDQKRFEDMDAPQQRREMSYYLSNDKGKFDKPDEFMAAITDWVKPEELFKAWEAADTAQVWHLINRAMANGLADAIDKGNGL